MRTLNIFDACIRRSAGEERRGRLRNEPVFSRAQVETWQCQVLQFRQHVNTCDRSQARHQYSRRDTTQSLSVHLTKARSDESAHEKVRSDRVWHELRRHERQQRPQQLQDWTWRSDKRAAEYVAAQAWRRLGRERNRYRSGKRFTEHYERPNAGQCSTSYGLVRRLVEWLVRIADGDCGNIRAQRFDERSEQVTGAIQPWQKNQCWHHA